MAAIACSATSVARTAAQAQARRHRVAAAQQMSCPARFTRPQTLTSPQISRSSAIISRTSTPLIRDHRVRSSRTGSRALTVCKLKGTVVITGASSGLGRAATIELANRGYYVVMACRDVAKGERVAQEAGLPKDSYRVEECNLADLSSVKAFAETMAKEGLDVLVCNGAVYFPQATEPTFTKDGFEESVGVNHIAHFYLVEKLLGTLQKSDVGRCVIVGSVTGNTNTVAGQVPPIADLGNLDGLKAGFQGVDNCMIDGKEFIGAKAYKDSKVCNMLSVFEFDKRYHESTGVNFVSLYPGCIADTPLFRNHNVFFRVAFPWLMKNVTKGYVSEGEAGWRLAEICTNPDYDKSGVYWSWKQGGDNYYENYNAPPEDRLKAFENEPSEEVRDANKGKMLASLTQELIKTATGETVGTQVAASSA